jgi:hypothetical protein
VALDVTDFLELLLAPRFAVSLGVGVAAGFGFYSLSGKDPSSAAVAFGIGAVGFVVGVIWHVAGGSKSGAA